MGGRPGTERESSVEIVLLFPLEAQQPPVLGPDREIAVSLPNIHFGQLHDLVFPFHARYLFRHQVDCGEAHRWHVVDIGINAIFEAVIVHAPEL